MNNDRYRLLKTVLLLLSMIPLPQLCGQEVTAGITGTVTDPSGAPVPNATVSAKDLARGIVSTTQSNQTGIYTLTRLPIGNYEIRVQASGFETASHAAIQLELNQTARIDVQLRIGQASSTMEVTDVVPILQTEATQVGTVMGEHTIANLPLETRNYNQLVLLTPGALTTSPGAFNTGQQTFNSGRPYINGNREQANYYLLDGMDNNEFVDNAVAYSPNVDAIQEFNVVTNNPSAEFGQFLGGVISVSTKSGTNEYHGSLFEYLRNDFFNANEWSRNFQSDPAVSGTPPKLRWNQFGGTFGGPIRKNKLFFFADYQGSRFGTPATTTAITTLTNQERTGNFSDLTNQLHYPGTTVPIPGNNLAAATICGPGQTFGSSPCINGLSRVALGIINSPLFPKQSSPGVLNNATNSVHTFTNGNQGDLKLDWAPTDKDRIFGRYTQQHVENPTTNSQPLLYNNSTDSNGNNVFPLWNGVVDYTRTFGATFVNDLRAGVNYYPAEANQQSIGAAAGAGALVPGEPAGFLPGLAFIGANLGGGNNGPFPFGTVNSAEIFHQTTIQVEDTGILTHAGHTMHIGFQALRFRNNFAPTSNNGAAGQINFLGQYTGDAEADLLLGLPSFMGLGGAASGTVGQRNSTFGLFFQDDWRVNKHLTLNLGLRWQLFTPIYEVHDRETNFGEISGKVLLAGRDGNSRALYNQYNGIANFLPRVGVAWTPWDNITVIRAAFSRSSFAEGTGEFNRIPVNAPWTSDLTTLFVAGSNGAIPSNQVFLDQGFTGLAGAAASSRGVCTVANVTSAPAACFSGARIHVTDPNYRPAVSNQWSLTIQHQFGKSFTAQAAYIGQHTDHLADILLASQRILHPDGTTSPSFYLSGNPALQNMAGQVRLNATTAIQNYNGLQLTAQQRLSKGLAFQANYTWSKCLTNSAGYYARFGDAVGGMASADRNFQQYAYNLGLDYGFCDHDATNLFSGYVNYDLPFGRNRMFGKNSGNVTNAFLGDWQANAIITVHGGFPVSVFGQGDASNTGSAESRPDCIAPSHQTPFRQNPNGPGFLWWDTNTFAQPAAGHLGNCGNGSVRGPGLKQVDFSLAKHFRITERHDIEFQAEAINVFNTPVFRFAAFQADQFGSPNFGVINASQGARNLQFALKYAF